MQGLRVSHWKWCSFSSRQRSRRVHQPRDADKQKQRRQQTHWLDRLHVVRLTRHTPASEDSRPCLRGVASIDKFLLGSQLGGGGPKASTRRAGTTHECQTEARSILLVLIYWSDRGQSTGTPQLHSHLKPQILIYQQAIQAWERGERGEEEKKKSKDRCKSKMVYFVKGAVGGDEKTWCATK